MNYLIGVTGSVATVLTDKLVSHFATKGDVKVVATESARHFLKHADIPPYSIYYDNMEWNWRKKGDPILHIELRDWADVLVIAPLSANTLAKAANGFCDNLLTSIIRAWDYSKPIICAPAMNTVMWHNPPTAQQLTLLKSWGWNVVDPQEKTLACGDVGVGAMALIETIVEKTQDALKWLWPLGIRSCKGLPIAGHPGSFGHARKYDVHTGVDLYVYPGASVVAMQSGIVEKVIPFTGKIAGFDWWNNTHAVITKTVNGYILYGEIHSQLQVGQIVKKGDLIGYVLPVLKEGKERPDIPGHSRWMLHVELYNKLCDNERGVWEGWQLGSPKPENLLDPTEFLIQAKPTYVPLLTME